MADPTDITQLDLQNLSPEQAAELARTRLGALTAQQHHALLGILGAVPELQKAGAAEYGQAGREREGIQQTAANVLKTTLEGKHLDIEKLGMQERLRALEQQIAYQNAQLALMGRQQTEAERRNVVEEQHQRVLEKPVVPGDILKEEAKNRASVEMLNKIGGAEGVPGLLSGVPGAKSVTDLLKTGPEAQQKAMSGLIKGYRAMGAEVPGGGGQAPVATHYRYNKDRSMRIPTDVAGNALGPPEPNR